MQREKNLQVQMFGKFRIMSQGKELSTDNFRSPMLVRLMAYIFSHHNSNIPTTELIDALWPNESSDNPIGALRNLIHRLRKLFRDFFVGGGINELLITGDGFYYCNKEVRLYIDAEEFEKLCKEAKAATSDQEKIEKCMKAIILYKGEYMSGYDDVYWLASMATFYQSLYLNTMKECASLLDKYGRYAEMEQIIRDALNNESLDEELHTYFVRSLIEQGKQKLAMEQYQKSVKILYENLGITSLDSMQKEYENLMKQEHEVQFDLTVIEKELCGETNEGAFLCEFGVFKKIYQLERCRAERFGISVFLLLISVRQEVKHEDEQNAQELFASSMKTLEDVLMRVLRSGDVIARYSQSQYILMLPTCQYETMKRITNRIDKKLYSTLKKKDRITVQYSMGEII